MLKHELADSLDILYSLFWLG